MTEAFLAAVDPERDLVIERVLDVPVDRVWAAWTQPKRLKPWFCPKPWETIDCEIDLRPGGIFRTVMRSPEGQEFPNDGCYLDVVPQRRLIWTGALGPGFRPNPVPHEVPVFTAVLELTPEGTGTRYKATVFHKDPDGRAKHETMGFYQGWGTMLEQLEAFCKGGG